MNAILKHVLTTILGALALSLMLGVESSKALENVKVYRGVLILEGKIDSGDFIRVRKFLGTKSNFDRISGGIFLASPGGNVREALEIGHLIRALQLSTDAPSGPPNGKNKFGESVIKANDLIDPKSNYLCASACFFLYVAGVHRNLTWVGRLGVHRPVQSESRLKTISKEDATKSNNHMHELVKNYLKDMDVPEKYVDLMFSVPPNELRLITQDEFDSDLQGVIPEFRNLIDAKCDPRTNEDKLKCRMQVQAELRAEAWHKVFRDN